MILKKGMSPFMDNQESSWYKVTNLLEEEFRLVYYNGSESDDLSTVIDFDSSCLSGSKLGLRASDMKLLALKAC